MMQLHTLGTSSHPWSSRGFRTPPASLSHRYSTRHVSSTAAATADRAFPSDDRGFIRSRVLQVQSAGENTIGGFAHGGCGTSLDMFVVGFGVVKAGTTSMLRRLRAVQLGRWPRCTSLELVHLRIHLRTGRRRVVMTGARCLSCTEDVSKPLHALDNYAMHYYVSVTQKGFVQALRCEVMDSVS
ncbi:uncharacterized protein K460DRAFT_354308 [Cucurbitaria berberidis CBS 394.84]|uniref:Uncharacterized protein n=1 Tax=Cucurbitaria berberidis CBS 394.84 TaxID=1168544 RepID=A0A9P4GQ16_9PLEO|nr:uncharacterized protein K460DRAFT_354308 [Cucurbitaria berberidis CBS 394.84]KAF1849464.1 hypothetical protein K460DRAFT_354308 [Cucurbitaria berberidis CBS 394.84]